MGRAARRPVSVSPTGSFECQWMILRDGGPAHEPQETRNCGEGPRAYWKVACTLTLLPALSAGRRALHTLSQMPDRFHQTQATRTLNLNRHSRQQHDARTTLFKHTAMSPYKMPLRSLSSLCLFIRRRAQVRAAVQRE